MNTSYFQEICNAVAEGTVKLAELNPEFRAAVQKCLDEQAAAFLANDPFAQAAAQGLEMRIGATSMPKAPVRKAMTWPFNEVKVENAKPKMFPF